MHGEAILVVVVLVFGCAAFFFGLICILCKAITWMGLGVAGLFRSSRRIGADKPSGGVPRMRVCPRERCRRVEYRRDARYCSQCGAPLSSHPGSDSLKSA